MHSTLIKVKIIAYLVIQYSVQKKTGIKIKLWWLIYGVPSWISRECWRLARKKSPGSKVKTIQWKYSEKNHWAFFSHLTHRRKEMWHVIDELGLTEFRNQLFKAKNQKLSIESLSTCPMVINNKGPILQRTCTPPQKKKRYCAISS